MTTTDSLVAGREAFAARRWRDVFEALSAADGEAPLEPEDLDRLGSAAYLLGDDAWNVVWPREHQCLADRGEFAGAARCAFWVAFGFMNEGEMGQAGGWQARAQRLVDDLQTDCAEQGYLLLPAAIEGCDRDPAGSLAAFTLAGELGERFHDTDLTALARHGQGRALIRLGEAARGMAVLDEVLVAVGAGELSPIVTGDIYCGAIEACHETFDVRRAREWTSALNRWCDAQPDLVAYRGQCLVYRSAILQTNGAWSDAMEVAREACTRLSEPVAHPAAGAAFYQRAELHRLRGEFTQAEESYRKASEHGRDPQPGLALLRLAQGQTDVAAASIRRILHETLDVLTRSKVLPASVDVLLEAGDSAGARIAADELSELAARFDAGVLLAEAAHAAGAVLLAEGEHSAALGALRRAHMAWRESDAPYETARTRVLIGLTCRELGDHDGANVEWHAARQTFEQLGAAPDLERLGRLANGAPPPAGGLTARELDILRLIATGRTNRAIGDDLVISEKTVARHVSNIFNKLGVSSRAAATAFAYDHGLLSAST